MTLKSIVLFAVLLSIALMALLFLAAIARARSGGRTRSFVGLCAVGLIYSTGYIFEILSPDLRTTLLAIRAEYVGIALLTPFLLLVVRDFLDNDKPRVATPVLFIIPAITLLLVNTLDFHSLFYIAPHIDRSSGLTIISFGKGPGYWLQVAYTTLSLAYGVLVFFKHSISGPQAKRGQARFMLIGCLLPWVGNILYLAGRMPLGIEPSPIFFSVTSGFFAIGFFRYRLFDLRPIARDIVFEQMRDAVLVTDQDGCIVDHNRAAGAIFPCLSESSKIKNIRDLAAASPSLAEALSENKTDCVVTLSLPKADQRFALHRSILSNRLGQSLGTAHVFMDITERVLLEQRLTALASTDELTGIYNRRHFFELARAELERAQRYNRPFGVAILDLDDFKDINDCYGHPAGDEALRLAARLFAKTLRTADIMGRYGGDEFAFAFPECDEQKTKEAAERLAHIVESAAFPYGKEVIRLSASVGAAGASGPPLPDLDDLLKVADERMYEKKKLRERNTRIQQ